MSKAPASPRGYLALVAGTVLATLAVQRHVSRLATPAPSRDRAAIPVSRDWKAILLRTFQQIDEDRLLATAAGVVFYGLLAIFPAVTALVSSYGLFADPSTIAANLQDLAVMLLRLASERRAGLFHVTNQGAATWFEVAQHVLAAGGFDPARVKPVSTLDLRPQRPAPRPANAVLDNAVLRMVGLPLLSQWQDAVTELVRQLQSDSTI